MQQPPLFFAQKTGTTTTGPIRLAQTGPIRVSWLSRWAVPFAWHKSPANPVIPAKPTVPCVVQVGDQWRLYFGQRPEGIFFGTADRPDATSWHIHPGPVLASATPASEPDSFDAGGVNAPCIVKLNEQHWRMYYVGYHPTRKTQNIPVHQVGVAESLDAGLNWKRLSKDPAIPHGPAESCDAFSTSSTGIIKHNGTWYLYYGGIAQVPYRVHVCLATSNDGVHFTKHPQNPVLPCNPQTPGQELICARPSVHLSNGLFRMWYTTQGLDAQGQPQKYRISYAESADGVHWERWPHNPVMNPSPDGWDDQMVGYGQVLQELDRYHMWYCGNNYQSIGYAHGQSSQPAVWLRALVQGNWSDWQPCVNGQTLTPASNQVQLRTETQNPAFIQNLQITRA